MSQNNISKLLEVMRQLRDPESGCPWDQKQSYRSIVPYTIEETYEVVDAIEREDFDDLKSELGDLLFQVVFYCEIAQEEKRFDFSDVVESICHKLVTRHPHVFSDKSYESDEELHRAWEQQKAKERQESKGSESVLDDIPLSLPALKRAQKMQKRAAKQGFDWPTVDGVWNKLHEEIEELKAEQRTEITHEVKSRLEDELGDVLFSTVNLARHLGLDSESALRRATTKFEERYRKMETIVKCDNVSLGTLSIEELEAYWQQSKRELNKS